MTFGALLVPLIVVPDVPEPPPPSTGVWWPVAVASAVIIAAAIAFATLTLTTPWRRTDGAASRRWFTSWWVSIVVIFAGIASAWALFAWHGADVDRAYDSYVDASREADETYAASLESMYDVTLDIAPNLRFPAGTSAMTATVTFADGHSEVCDVARLDVDGVVTDTLTCPTDLPLRGDS